MMKEILNFLYSEELEEKSLDVNLENFRELEALKSQKTVFAVDGGSSIIVDGGTWNISKVKIASLSYKNGEKRSEEGEEYIIGTMLKNKKMNFKIIPHVNFTFQPNSTKIDEMPNLIRSILEWLKIKSIAENSGDGAIILRDGAFTSNEAYEKAIINNTVETCKNKGVSLIGVCKTSRTSTENGRPVVGVVNQVGSAAMPDKKWLYSDGELSIAKLHEKTGFCYKLESAQKDNLIKNLSIISYYSSDPELLGYPYPLLKVDKIARVKDFEKEMENAKLKALARSLGKNFVEIDEKTTIMHSLLDKRAYR